MYGQSWGRWHEGSKPRDQPRHSPSPFWLDVHTCPQGATATCWFTYTCTVYTMLKMS